MYSFFALKFPVKMSFWVFFFCGMSCWISHQAQASVYPGIPSLPDSPSSWSAGRGRRHATSPSSAKKESSQPTTVSLTRPDAGFPHVMALLGNEKKRTPGLPHWRLYLFPLKKYHGCGIGSLFRRFLGLFEVSLPYDDGTNITKLKYPLLFGELCTFFGDFPFLRENKVMRRKKLWSELWAKRAASVSCAICREEGGGKGKGIGWLHFPWLGKNIDQRSRKNASLLAQNQVYVKLHKKCQKYV